MTLKWKHSYSVIHLWTSVEYKGESKVTCFDRDTHILDIHIYSGQSHIGQATVARKYEVIQLPLTNSIES